jgi:hypothetical protein
MRYAATRLSDGVASLELEPGQEHALRMFPAYAKLLESFEPWRAEPAAMKHMTVIVRTGCSDDLAAVAWPVALAAASHACARAP